MTIVPHGKRRPQPQFPGDEGDVAPAPAVQYAPASA